jgi:hypothetical protein
VRTAFAKVLAVVAVVAGAKEDKAIWTAFLRHYLTGGIQHGYGDRCLSDAVKLENPKLALVPSPPLVPRSVPMPGLPAV